MLVRSARPSPAVFRICGNESQPGLQILEKLATPMRLVRTLYKTCRSQMPQERVNCSTVLVSSS